MTADTVSSKGRASLRGSIANMRMGPGTGPRSSAGNGGRWAVAWERRGLPRADVGVLGMGRDGALVLGYGGW